MEETTTSTAFELHPVVWLLISIASLVIFWFIIKTAVAAGTAQLRKDIHFFTAMKEMELKKAGFHDEIKQMKDQDAFIEYLNKQKRMGYIGQAEYEAKMKELS